MRRRLGLTLIEVLTVIAVMSILAVAVGRTYQVAIGYEMRARKDRSAVRAIRVFEDNLRNLIEHAYISNDATDTSSYFTTSPSSAPGGTTSNNQLGGGGDTLVFTAIGLKPPGTVLNPTEQDDFETLNSKFGPQGGVAEIQLALTPTGQTQSGDTGLFLREQRPADADSSQGGTERLMMAGVTQIGFEFFDGLQWQTSWDTLTSGIRRLPSAVRVRFQMTDETEQRSIVIRVPFSDVTPSNPVTQSS